MIDSHQHFWRLARGDYGWLVPSLAAIHRDFGPADLAPILARHGIDRTILVQAAPTVAETAYLVELARKAAFVAGVVGWTDFESPGVADAITALAREPLIVGLRPMVQDLADDRWLAQPSLAPAFAAMAAHGLVFDALVKPRHLPALLHVLERHPDLAVVVDHGAKPDLARGDLAGWRRAIARVAASPQATCKLSGLVTEAREGAGIDVLQPCVDTLLECFGPERVMWGSDWPVVELAGGYDRWRALSLTLLEPLNEQARESVLGRTAARVYLRSRGRAGR
jgi:L-fuconolactonase